MKRMLPWALLAISLVVNAAFLFGAVQAQRQAERLTLVPEARSEAVADRLSLTGDQRAALEELRESLQQRREADRAARAADNGIHSRMMEELVRPTYDREAMEALLTAHSARRTESWMEMGAEVHAFLSELDDDQRETFRRLATEDRSGFLGPLLFSSRESRGN